VLWTHTWFRTELRRDIYTEKELILVLVPHRRERHKYSDTSPVLVAQAYNPSYSGGRDQEDYGLKPTPGK
jgi:hypothetical protein